MSGRFSPCHDEMSSHAFSARASSTLVRVPAGNLNPYSRLFVVAAVAAATAAARPAPEPAAPAAPAAAAAAVPAAPAASAPAAGSKEVPREPQEVHDGPNMVPRRPK